MISLEEHWSFAARLLTTTSVSASSLTRLLTAAARAAAAITYCFASINWYSVAARAAIVSACASVQESCRW